jgi:hypothetical protein
MKRQTYTLTYTSAITYAETQIIEALIEAAQKPELTLEEQEGVQNLSHMLPEVEQVRITVAQVNGLGKAYYERLADDARHFFMQATGIQPPVPDLETLAPEHKDIVTLAFSACAAMAATVKYEQRTTKVIARAEGVDFEDTEWEEVELPGPFKTIEEWVYDCPAILQSSWASNAYDANPDLWRRSTDDVAKNFGAVSANASKKR